MIQRLFFVGILPQCDKSSLLPNYKSISHGHVRHRRLKISSPVIRSWCSLAHLLSVVNSPKEYFVQGLNEKSFSPCFWSSTMPTFNSAMCMQVKIYASLLPSKTCQKYAQNTLGTKAILSRGGRGKMFNRGLMNKLMKIE